MNGGSSNENGKEVFLQIQEKIEVSKHEQNKMIIKITKKTISKMENK